MNIDIDWLDPDYIKAMPDKLGLVAHDQTSNQLWIDVALQQEYNASLLRQTAEELKDKGWLHIYTRAVRYHCIPGTTWSGTRANPADTWGWLLHSLVGSAVQKEH